MKIEQVAIQLFTLRDHCKTAQEYAATLKKVREIGYKAVQISGIGAEVTPKEIRAITDGEGLAIAGTHEDSNMILDKPEQVVEILATLGTPFTAYPYPAGIDFNNPADVERLITKLDAAGAVLHRAGQVLCYHNHAHEFYRVNGQPLLQTIYERTNPSHLQGEPDTHWVQAGGGDPVEWCKMLKNRIPMLHLKDYQVDPMGNRNFAEIGYGNLDFKKIIPEAEAGGCQWYIVEQDVTPGCPFASIKKSFDYIKANLCA